VMIIASPPPPITRFERAVLRTLLFALPVQMPAAAFTVTGFRMRIARRYRGRFTASATTALPWRAGVVIGPRQGLRYHRNVQFTHLSGML
jgi:hypothetical protein